MCLDTILKRRAVYPVQFNNKPIPKEKIATILESANWAPTHRRTEPWRFKVFFSEASRKALSNFLGATYQKTSPAFSEVKLKKILEKPLQSACVIAICFQRDPKESVPEWEEIAATAMAVQNMWLTAHELKVGAYWSSHGIKDQLYEHIPFLEGEKCLGFFYMGNFDHALESGTRNTSIHEKTRWF